MVVLGGAVLDGLVREGVVLDGVILEGVNLDGVGLDAVALGRKMRLVATVGLGLVVTLVVVVVTSVNLIFKSKEQLSTH
ncbi:hypothetical protein Y032_0036g3358 [Ancylostoma ceylanicum]|uniref:Uncharacterized protein n=1 Tax=Ancylostoma ceylanicum TaxID=53326 RepID=A0A016UKP3_9BILA|nr:hypothetical protein Y032_0036g3358 [Ancylostoma ceylanicum]